MAHHYYVEFLTRFSFSTFCLPTCKIQILGFLFLARTMSTLVSEGERLRISAFSPWSWSRLLSLNWPAVTQFRGLQVYPCQRTGLWSLDEIGEDQRLDCTEVGEGVWECNWLLVFKTWFSWDSTSPLKSIKFRVFTEFTELYSHCHCAF